MAHKIAVVGEKDVVIPFQLIGFDAFPVNDGQEARKQVDELAKSEYGIIYLTETIAEQIPDTISHYDTQVVPAVILIPSHKGSLGIGKKRVQDNVEKAVGQNIL
ncbi:V-type ATP synthase subunit F [Aerococcus sanguinicola]|uniref:V-type ATP synthase subunit F n=1 Tax=unclassified Aerococcus TaxID=2618060 RepID=UPI0008A58B22|nr:MULTISPECIES: V-type ATP synthase subunit F [unclassified Aerococcus]KAB0647308.1 V-type ATP synthase subunit F [Aerococcus sanguinicola]MDK6233230.1 V-type ATP synthase subunit F [Aerococcus sp. UMB10185]MDK6804660.1 V-type ATP synthase subunit F [Aerococcus sp. UMB7834]MDK6856067.1 V-type ATP synthase subunit F [Aerococcus sp. UMB7533]MDK8503029.1 V-type ATP synthase subunit F [Aerococcus sp. UMB1112A]